VQSSRQLRQTREGPLFGILISSPQAIIGEVMHASRPAGKRVKQAWTATESLPEILGLEPAPLMQVRLPTGIGQTMAVPACEMSAAQAVQLQDLPSAAAHEEKSFATERAGDAPYRDRLITDNQLMPIPSKRRQLDYAGVHLPSSKLPFFE